MDLTRKFIDEIYSKAPKKNYETNKIIKKNVLTKSGVLIWQILQITKFRIIKNLDKYLLY